MKNKWLLFGLFAGIFAGGYYFLSDHSRDIFEKEVDLDALEELNSDGLDDSEHLKGRIKSISWGNRTLRLMRRFNGE